LSSAPGGIVIFPWRRPGHDGRDRERAGRDEANRPFDSRSVAPVVEPTG